MSSEQSKGSIQMTHLFSGVSAGVISTLLLHPLDLIKVRLQVNEGTGVALRPSYQGIMDLCKNLVIHKGMKGLYQGVVPNMVGSGCAWGFYFVIYNTVKEYRQKDDLKKELSKVEYMTMAAISGALTLSITNPIWVVKTRLFLQYDKEIKLSTQRLQPTYYKGLMHCLSSVYKSEGIRGLYKGFVPGLFGTSHGAVQFVSYESMKNYYNQSYDRSINYKLSMWEYLLLGSLSKLIAASTTYPYQVVRSRLQDQHRVYTGAVDVMTQMWRFEGIRGFYKGLLPSLLRVTPASGIVFVVYETITSCLLSAKHL